MTLASFLLIGSIFIFLVGGISSDVNKEQWSFIFPNEIIALRNSDVTIPCTFTAPVNHSEVNIIWFKYHLHGYPQVFNREEPSKVIEEYRGRTTLVGYGTNSCTLKIKDVTKIERFHPGISEEINSGKLHYKDVKVKIQGCHEDESCKDWTFTFPKYINALQGSCVHIPCTFTHPKGARDFNFFWYSERITIFNNKSRSDVDDRYKGRTFLTGNTENNCSLKIINIEKSKEREYFPGINDQINSITLQNTSIPVSVKENPPQPSISGNKNMKVKQKIYIACYVEHTCPSSPPTLKWNITGHPIKESHYGLQALGRWRMKSKLTYTASYTDDKTVLKCAATFPNNKTSVKTITLTIRYRPMNVAISADGNTDTAKDNNVTLLCSSKANPSVDNYTWYQISQGKELLHGYGDKITVKNTTTGKYICVAANKIGKTRSSMFRFTEQYQKSVDENVIYMTVFPILGFICLSILALLIYMYWRAKTHQASSETLSSHKNSQRADATYMSLLKTVSSEYESIKPSFPDKPAAGGDITSDNQYENLQKK
ncbi:B-cell receptor CD22-like isoform X1 [Pyxicephalus adspersus]|uniref:B-cell receptor CD22-like isoform X1 n=1 Tax=Pyxicephalus adspersus TaxID=30357 RepID=UPI003B5BCFC1